METSQIPVNEQQPAVERSKSYEIARKSLLATIGVGVVAVEAVTTLVERLVERGEQSRAEARMRAEAAQPKPADRTAAPAEVDVLQSRVEQLKAELESLRTREAPEEGAQG